jgi:hypothetical protein
LLALLLVLIAIAVVGLKPWAPSSLVPGVAISPDLNVGLDEAAALPPRKAASVADASVVRHPSSELAAERVASVGHDEPATTTTDAALAVSPAQPVANVGGHSEPAQPAEPSPAPAAQPIAAPAPEPPSAPVTAPIAVDVVEGGPRTPVTAGVGGIGKEEECEGGEYVLVITPEGKENGGVPSQFEIRIEYVGSDGSRDEFSLQGGENDVRELVAMFSAQGGCVQVEEESADGVVEPVGEEPEAGAEAAAPVETLEPDLP